ncbi:MAG: hypothetical protein EZS28_022359 [Streblomastix strix]|uniref:Uncharacterized protein n=1 Tax=Streblomastix strix TaxID=222440 RepID=A0A5J4VI27_9EUKA|nr:MAG: hypothetical protein EZS28_022359 [Streblomastix strix]
MKKKICIIHRPQRSFAFVIARERNGILLLFVISEEWVLKREPVRVCDITVNVNGVQPDTEMWCGGRNVI